MNKKLQRQSGKGAIELIEEATHLLRLLPANILACYYVGSLPFVLGFLYFWADMTWNAFAYRHVAEAAFSISLLFIWMKCWQAIFASMIRTYICNESNKSWSLRRVIRLIIVQASIQSSGLFVLPVALLMTLPFGWVYAFYQNISVFGSGETNDTKAICKKSWQQAQLFSRQNHMVLFILSVFGFFIFLNLAIVTYAIPHLLNTLFGIETVFAKVGWNMLNTTFLAVVCGTSYLLLDPLVKIIYGLRCFYGESLHTGEDLKVELRNIRMSRVILITLLIASLVQAANPADAGSADYKPMETVISAKEMDQSINDVVSRQEYTWKMPREKPDKSNDGGILTEFINGMIDTLCSWFMPVKEWIKKVFEWIIEHLMKLFKVDRKHEPLGIEWIISVNVLLYMLLCLVASILGVTLWRMYKNRKGRKVEIAMKAEAHVPDIANDNIAANEFPANTWLNLANELIRQGNLRLGLRALYLASLSHLSQHEIISIARFKSNRDYEREVHRKAHNMPDVLSAFTHNVRIFENIWYGMHEVTGDIVKSFNENHERIMAIGK